MTVRMSEMTWQDFQKAKENAVVILPIGSTEQHGPHLPLSVDAILSTGLAEMVAEGIGGIVAPTLCYGYKSAPLSGGGPLFPGTLDLNGITFMNLVSDVLEELIRDGIKKLFILNGHFENEAFLLEAIDLLSRKYSDVTFVEGSWWDQITDEAMTKVFDEVEFPGWELEHAAIAETSMTMFFRPDLVHMDRFVEDGVDKKLSYSIYPASLCKVPETGLLATARTASLEKGRLLAEDITRGFVDVLKETTS